MSENTREILKFTPREGREIVWGDDERFVTISNEIVDTRRWTLTKRLIVKRVSDGKFFETFYSKGATEMQEEKPFEYDKEAEFNEVKEIQKTITDYVWEE
jgi:hypothetical protein